MSNGLSKLCGKKVVIYGTGKIAERVINGNPTLCFIGALDRLKFSGKVCEIPIIMWDDIEAEVEALVIAATVKNYSTIYWRILDNCIVRGIKIYGVNGEDLIKYFGVGVGNNKCHIQPEKKELKRLISRYDVISFDIFDTLVMRKILEPTDIFDVVEANLRKKEIIIPNFKRYRRTAELQSCGGDIYQIYDILAECLGLEEDVKKQILEEELRCEEQFILPRVEMIEVYKYAIELQKEIYIVSDMYLSNDIIKKLLLKCGISKFDNLLVSCEYGMWKGNGLFDILTERLKGKSCLHIGDNIDADFFAAQKSGIDAYKINSAYDLLHTSCFHYVSSFAKTVNDKILLGHIIADLFNSPFSSIHKVEISSLQTLCNVFVVPFVVNWVYKLKKNIENNNYDGVLFAARDGYVFQKIYDLLPDTLFEKVPSYYIYCSRKFMTRLGMDSYDEIRDAIKWFNLNVEDMEQIENVFGICDEKNFEDEMSKIYENILKESEHLRRLYKEYLVDQGIDLSKKYLLFDLDGRGTSHYFLNKVFIQGLNALYLFKYHTQSKYELESDALYNFELLNKRYSSLNTYALFFEIIFSAPHPAILSIDKEKRALYEKEVRSIEVKSFMERMQEFLILYVQDYIQHYYIDDIGVSKEFAEHILENFSNIDYVGECNVINTMSLYDEMSKKYFRILR